MTAERWNELKSLFAQAVEMEPRERSRFVAAVSADHPDLHQNLCSLLEHNLTAGPLLDGPILSQERIVEYLAAGVRTFQAGQIAGGRFRIEAFLGEGGMGEVYRAADLELGGQLALKTLRPVLSADDRLIRQLKQETSTARLVTHRNVCRIFDLFTHDAGSGRTLIFLTMELLEGETLAARIRREGKISTKSAFPVAGQIIQGLAAAHEAGVVHRDLKSGNVYLARAHDGTERVVITDFGLACAVGESGRADEVGPVAGTLAFAAPEQLSSGAVTAAADVYSLGVVLFEMVTGKLPFPAGTLAQVAEWKKQPPPSPQELVPGLEANWQAAIQACLQPDSPNRPASPGEVLKRLRSPILSRRRLLAAAVLPAAGAVWWFRSRPKSLHPEALKSFRRGQDFARRRNEEGLRNAVTEFQRAVELEPHFADAWVGIADAYSAMANFDIMPPAAALAAAREAALKAITMGGRSAHAMGVMGYVTSLDVHQWHNAEPYFRRAVAADPKDAMVRLWYGAHLSKLGRSQDAFRQLRAGLELDPMSLTLNQQLAMEFFRTRRFQDYYNQANELVRLQPFEPSSHLALARSLEFLGRYREALAECAEAEKYSGTITSICFRGLIEASMGDLPAARRDAEQVRLYWSSKPFQALLLASLYSRIGERRQAVDILNAGFERGDSTILTAPSTPYLDNLVGDPGYQKFLGRIGWPNPVE